VGVQLPKRPVSRVRTLALAATLAAGLLVLTSCSEDTTDTWRRVAMPEPATTEAWQILEFWQWSWVAAMATGILVWGLMFYVAWQYRRRSNDDIPVQTRYNLPLEIFYTIAPFIMVLVFFSWTVEHQHEITAVDEYDHTVVVVGQQWSWTFNYVDEPIADGRNVFEVGTASYTPTLVLPVDESVRFELHSPDVIHSFWITAFLYKEDIIPGKVPENEFVVTPDREGTFQGKCAELCGTSHARMLFNVEVVSRAEYDAYLEDQIDAGYWSDEVLLGGEESITQAGLETELPEGGTE
jgi:cytochrome c oxidase subunit 2